MVIIEHDERFIGVGSPIRRERGLICAEMPRGNIKDE